VPHHRVDIQSLSSIDLAELDVLVLPSGGGYGRQIERQTTANLAGWVDQGGLLIAVGGAVDWLGDQEIIELERWQAPESDTEDNEVVELTPANRPLYTPGAALATRLQTTHPLASGLRSAPAAMFQGSTILLASGDPRQDLLLAADQEPVIAGFAWPEARQRLEGSLLVGVRSRGQGGVVLFAQEPAYRLFWRSTAPLFLNAVMYGPSLLERDRLLE
jgi:hypothetical protein